MPTTINDEYADSEYDIFNIIVEPAKSNIRSGKKNSSD